MKDRFAPNPDCEGCPLTKGRGRRAFLRDLFAGVLAVRFGSALARRGAQLAYPLPSTDGAIIDKENQLILARYQQKVYAFNLSCPHQHTALRWYPDDGQFQCPKHHSRYRPDGVFISGRATRSMDRLGIQRDGANVIVDVDKFYREDQNPAEWAAAVVTLPSSGL